MSNAVISVHSNCGSTNAVIHSRPLPKYERLRFRGFILKTIKQRASNSVCSSKSASMSKKLETRHVECSNKCPFNMYGQGNVAVPAMVC